jgi:hypothetical protein
MGKRAATARSTGNYLPYGKPAEVVIEHHAAEKLSDGRVIDAVYVEKFAGFTTDSSTKPRANPDRGDFHDGHCSKRVGVGRVWEREGRDWCHGCYTMRFGEEPPADLFVRARKPPRRAKKTALERFLENKPTKL